MTDSFYLSPSWLTESSLDPELTEYRLKAFIKKVKEAYRKLHLQPGWEESRFHEQQLQSFRNSWEAARAKFSRKIDRIDWENSRLIWTDSQKSKDWENWLEEMTAFAREEFHLLSVEGKEIFMQILEEVKIEPVGVEPLYQTEGYLIFTQEERNERLIFRYHLGPVHWQVSQTHNYRAEFLFLVKPAEKRSLISLKSELIRQYPDLPNPATWSIESEVSWPLEPTLLPIALFALKSRMEKRN